MFVRTNYRRRVVQQRLLEIAIAEFASKGLEGASTRSIAAAAGTAMSSITYHFGGKEGLYLAAADHIAAQMGGTLSHLIDGGVPEGMTPAAARTLIHAILASLVEKMTGQKNTSYSLFIMREQMEPTAAFERIYGGMLGTMLRTLAHLVQIATGRDDGDTARVAVVTLIGQVVTLRASRATVLKLMQCPDLDASAISALGGRIAANTDAILDRLIAERQELS
ncbi:CerR family C-terminal domain-containing protein [Sphingomonas sp. PL20]|uniref:CerR family C-terminal domain-containing protein n=2 Tax=Pseudomonadota TaxID=1224 RepID=UPI002FF024AB